MDLPKEMNSRFNHYLRLFLRQRRLFYLAIGLPLIFTLIFTAIATPTYRASAKLLPTVDTSNMGVIGILTGLFSSRGSASADGAPSSFLFVDILTSRTVIENVLDHEVEFVDRHGKDKKGKLRGLLGYSFGTKGIEDFLDNNTAKSNFENGIISLTSKANDPVLSAVLLNTWIDKLDEFNQNVRVTQAGENLKYLTQRLEESKTEYRDAQDSLVSYLEANRGYPMSATPKVEADVRRLTYLRDSKEQIYQLLIQEYELAALTKRKTTPIVSILDSAVPPTEKHGPKRIPVFAFSFAFTILILLICLSIIESQNPTPYDTNVGWNELISAIKTDFHSLVRVFRRKR